MLAAAVVACTTAPPDEQSIQPSSLRPSTVSETSQPTPSWPATAAPTEVPSPTPPSTLAPTTAPSDERVLSDIFWDEFVAHVPPALLDYEFASLEDATEQAHLVVVGRVEEVYVGEDWILGRDEPGVPFAYARIIIDEVLKGEPITRKEGSVELQLGFVERTWQPSQTEPLPAHANLFFVMHEATDRQLRGLGPRNSEIAPFAYFIPTPQAVLRDIGGQIAVLGRPMLEVHYGPDGFPLPLQGAAFSEVLDFVRQLGAR